MQSRRASDAAMFCLFSPSLPVYTLVHPPNAHALLLTLCTTRSLICTSPASGPVEAPAPIWPVPCPAPLTYAISPRSRRSAGWGPRFDSRIYSKA
ncbi:hypothetical protein IG631_04850 [Alternaria alternata]|nr:hypothetical protein IG631_04850 [Alternaria alternata]